MALVKRKTEEPVNVQEKRNVKRDLQGLLVELADSDVGARRWAARDLAEYPEAVEHLCNHLDHEAEQSVREAILDSLLKIGGDGVVQGLVPLLRSEDAALRNGVIEVLQSMPDSVAPHMAELLHDKDSDVRIFAIDILQVLAHPETPAWLLEVIKNESHVNVLATAIDRLAEVGTAEMVPELQALKERFSLEPFIGFAVDMAVRRIEGQ